MLGELKSTRRGGSKQMASRAAFERRGGGAVSSRLTLFLGASGEPLQTFYLE